MPARRRQRMGIAHAALSEREIGADSHVRRADPFGQLQPRKILIGKRREFGVERDLENNLNAKRGERAHALAGTLQPEGRGVWLKKLPRMGLEYGGGEP